jgi:hypothetical protein
MAGMVGGTVGDWVGAAVLGESVGDTVGDTVGNGVGDTVVGDAVGQSLPRFVPVVPVVYVLSMVPTSGTGLPHRSALLSTVLRAHARGGEEEGVVCVSE